MTTCAQYLLNIYLRLCSVDSVSFYHIPVYLEAQDIFPIFTICNQVKRERFNNFFLKATLTVALLLATQRRLIEAAGEVKKYVPSVVFFQK